MSGLLKFAEQPQRRRRPHLARWMHWGQVSQLTSNKLGNEQQEHFILVHELFGDAEGSELGTTR